MTRRAKTVLNILLLAAIASLFAAPIARAETPAEFITAAIGEDFAGSNELRGKIYYTDGQYYVGEVSGCGCGPYWRGVVFFEDSPIFIVSDYKVLGWAMTSRNRAKVQVRYRIIAEGVGDNSDHRILPLAEPQMVDVTFKVLRKKGEWLWVDPPEKPYVGWQATREAMQRNVDRYQEAIQRAENDQFEPRKNETLISLQNRKTEYQRQLEILDSLRPLLPNIQP